MASTKPAAKWSSAQPSDLPVLQVTRFDRVSAMMIAAVGALIATVIGLSVVWATNRADNSIIAVPVEMVDLSGGIDDGAIDETLRVDSPEDEVQDPSLADIPSEDMQIEEMMENVVEFADQATNQAQKQFELQTLNSGKTGSATGTGRRALGMGPGEAGLPRDQRWFIRFSERGALDEYARQLDYFGIELGALTGAGEIIYLSKLASGRPQVRRSKSGKGENRLYMTWQGGNRQKGDIQLFKKAGIDVGAALIMHFYPPTAEQMLAKLEFEYRNRPAEQIRRTYFLVRSEPNGYRFLVSRQSYF